MKLRNAQWYAGQDRNAYIHRAWMRRGVPGDAFTGRPQIAIANTASDLTGCSPSWSGTTSTTHSTRVLSTACARRRARSASTPVT
ncbi:hypothetical protein ACWEKM_40325 [Streptomyces sp. NPDC004752]